MSDPLRAEAAVAQHPIRCAVSEAEAASERVRAFDASGPAESHPVTLTDHRGAGTRELKVRHVHGYPGGCTVAVIVVSSRVTVATVIITRAAVIPALAGTVAISVTTAVSDVIAVAEAAVGTVGLIAGCGQDSENKQEQCQNHSAGATGVDDRGLHDAQTLQHQRLS